MIQSIRSLSDLSGKRVLIRASLNVPIEGGKVVSDFRLKRTIETIEYVRSKGARVIVCGHLSGEKTASLFPVYESLKKTLAVTFVNDVVGEKAKQAAANLREGSVLLLENLRRMSGEEGNDLQFATLLKSFADIYVMDDFSVLHRKHASVVLVPAQIPSYAGLLVTDELEHLSRALKPETPSLAILGGAKFSTKEPLIKKCLPLYSFVFVGGALANDVFKAKGYEIGLSLVASTPESFKDLLVDPKVLLPSDVVVDGPNGRETKLPSEVTPRESILDCGDKTIEDLGPHIARAKTILWNGPLGNYEKGFDEHTEALAKLIAKSGAHTIVGGGDTVAAIHRTTFDSKRVFVSTGGGAMIDFLAEGTLPGLEALGFIPQK